MTDTDYTDPRRGAKAIVATWREKNYFTIKIRFHLAHDLKQGPPSEEWWKDLRHLALRSSALTEQTIEAVRKEVEKDD